MYKRPTGLTRARESILPTSQTLQILGISHNPKRAENQVPPYPVAIAPELVEKLEDCLQQLHLAPNNISGFAEGREVNLLVCVDPVCAH